MKVIAGPARRENLSIRGLHERVAICCGHHIMIGSATKVTDRMQE